MSQSLWAQPGETFSHKNASKEFGLEEHEIIEAMREGKLQYKENSAHGNPYYRLLRTEVRVLAVELRGAKHLEKHQIEHQIKNATKEINSCKRKQKSLEKEKAILVSKLANL